MKNKKLLWPIIFFVIGCIILAVGLFVDPTLYKSLIHTDKNLKYVGGYINDFAQYTAYTLRALGAAAAISSFLGFVFHKQLVDICSAKTSIVAVCISGFVSSGIYSALGMYIYAFTGSSTYPIRSKSSAIGGLISALGVFILWWLYSWLRSKQKSKKGTLFDVTVAFIFTPGFFCLAVAVWYYLNAMFSGRTY